MSTLDQLYQEVILDHNRSPRNFGRLDKANRTAQGHNPLCGDKVSVYLDVEDGVIRNITFEGAGCAISTASASLMTDCLKGLTVDQARTIFRDFRDLVTGQVEEPSDELGKLEVFRGVRKYPVRVKCASLPWHTLEAALNKSGEIAATE